MPKLPLWVWGLVAAFVLGALTVHLGWLSVTHREREKTLHVIDSTNATHAADTARLNEVRRASDRLTAVEHQQVLALRDTATRQHVANRALAGQVLLIRRQLVESRQNDSVVPRPVVDTLLAAYDSVVAENVSLRSVVDGQIRESAALRRALTVADAGLSVRDRRIAVLDSMVRHVSPATKGFFSFLRPSRPVAFVAGAVVGFLISKRGGV